MEKATEVLMGEGSRKRDCPDSELESHRILAHEEKSQAHEEKSQQILALGEEKSRQYLARLAMEDAFWDHVDEAFGVRPVRADANHAEQKPYGWKPYGWKLDLPLVLKEGEKDEADESEEDNDDPDLEALQFRKRWNRTWSHRCGSFDETTLIPPMRYTDEPPIGRMNPCDTLEIFSAMIAGIGGGFQWPLCVFGLVAIRDKVDRNRNIIFQRSRSECQTLTKEDPYLLLTGPTRAIVFSGPVTIEVYLKVRGPTELEDKTLCCLAREMRELDFPDSFMFHRAWSSKFSTVEFTLGHISDSVEATISVRVISGSWPHGFQGEFAACLVRTGDIFHGCKHEGPVIGGRTRSTSVDHKKISLLSFGDEKMPMTGDAVIELSRSVVCAKSNSNLEVSVRAWQDGNNAVQASAAFAAKEAGRSSSTLAIGSCKMVVTVAWSLISKGPER